ncbi:MAG TPA: SCO family protein [Solirubrobacteraceae bacterium]|jgi:protein SCO1/2|nr:SCO family protein [Solirubrobacteraceae bacterium]
MCAPRRPRRAPRCVAAATLALTLIGASVGCARGGSNDAAAQASSADATSASGFEGGLLPSGLQARQFTLTDQYSRRVSLRSFRGRVVILAFLYSSSKSTAPLIAQQIRGALDELALEPHPPALAALAVSVDPTADTPPRVHAFLRASALAGRIEYLTGTPAQLRPIWHAYRVLPAGAGPRAYEDAAFVLLIDRAGDERVELPLEQLTPEALAHDVRRLAEE